MTLEEARKVVPFQILTPEYLPEGYESEEFVAVIKGPAPGGREALSKPLVVWGVNAHYSRAGATSPSDGKLIFVEQHLYIGRPVDAGGVKLGVEDIGGLEADVWLDKNLAGDEIVSVAWEDSSRGVGVNITSLASKDETLRVARSFR